MGNVIDWGLLSTLTTAPKRFTIRDENRKSSVELLKSTEVAGYSNRT
jgi:hypothetical protein